MFAHIDTESGSRLTELAARTGVTPQSMSDVVTGMIRDGYLRRVPDPTDGRARLLQLTPRGQEAIDTGRAMIARLERCTTRSSALTGSPSSAPSSLHSATAIPRDSGPDGATPRMDAARGSVAAMTDSCLDTWGTHFRTPFPWEPWS